ncbi:MAG: hypothetical protein MRY63_10980 [Neomegalonema sp.]|nr:hypothetical protein [Neomegalonema sp.]
MQFGKFILAAIGSLGLAACASNQTTTATPVQDLQPLTAFIKEAGFIPLPVPNSNYYPGAIVQVVPLADGRNRLEWYSEMRSCGAFDEELAVKEGSSIGFSTGKTYKANLGLSLLTPTAGAVNPNANYLSGAQITIDKTAMPVLDRLKVDGWRQRVIEQGGAGLPAQCRLIAQDTPRDLFIIREALAIRSGKITYLSQAGAEVEVAGLAKELAAGNAGLSYDGGSGVTIDEPLFIGVRRLSYVKGAAPEPVTRAPEGPTTGSPTPSGTPPAATLPSPHVMTGPAPARDLEPSEIEALFSGAVVE